MDLKQFILDTLLPYKEDPSTCAWNPVDKTCLYLTEDGRKCAVGKHLIDGVHQKFLGDVGQLDDEYDLDKILTPEAREQKLSIKIWQAMQGYHDQLANSQFKIGKEFYIEQLENLINQPLEDLREYPDQ